MTLLNYLINKMKSKKEIVKELSIDNEKRLKLWLEHLDNYPKREILSKYFNYGNVDKAVMNFNETIDILNQIFSLISPEFITIENEEKLDEEILADIENLNENHIIEGIIKIIAYEKEKQKEIISLFQEVHDCLKTELHLINLIKTKPPNAKELLLQLFEIIFHKEARLYKIFKEELHNKKSDYTAIMNITHAILLEENYKEKKETAEEKFIKKIVESMGKEESKNQYRKLAEEIYDELIEMAGGTGQKDANDFFKALNKMSQMTKSETILRKIIIKLRPKYEKEKIAAIIIAFHQSYEAGHFDELQGLLIT